MGIGYDRAILNKMMADPAYSYDLPFREFIRMYKTYSDENYDVARAIIPFGKAKPVAKAEHNDFPDLGGFDSFASPVDTGSTGGGDSSAELLEQSDIDALLAQMQ